MRIQERWFREIGYWSRVVVVGVVFGVSIQFASAAWMPRPADPATASVSGPLTTGVGDQVKAGGSISLGGGGSLYSGGVVAAPWLCIGADCRNSWPTGGGTEVDTLGSVVARGNSAGGNWIIVGGVSDGNNGGYYLNPDYWSQLNLLNVNNRIDTPFIYDSNDYGYYLDPNGFSRLGVIGIHYMYDNQDWGYYLDLSEGSQFNFLRAHNADVPGSLSVGALYYYSDNRLKENVAPLKDSLQKILNLRGVSFDWKKDEYKPQGRQLGVIAQEVEKEFPEVVSKNSDGMKMVNYEALIAPLIESVKTQQTEIQDQQDHIKVLEERIKELEKNK